jgi:hypothetical protein
MDNPNRLAEQSARYLEEVLLQPDQVDDVALTACERDSGQDDPEHPHGDY